MANELISPFQKYTPMDWKGLTTHNNLGQMYMTQPELISKLIKPIFYVNDTVDDLMKFINSFPALEVPTERVYEWMLMGRSEKNIPLVKASLTYNGSAVISTDKVGKQKGRFYLVFNEHYFDPDHIIVGENTDLYAVRIVSEVQQLGNEFWYECELITNDINLYIPYSDLASGTRWSIDYSLAESTMSKRGTGMSHTSPFRMSTWMSFLRKEYTVPGSMIQEGKNNPLAFSFLGDKGKEITTWINKADYDFRQQYYREIGRLLMFGKSNRLADGSFYNTGESGYEIKAGPGLRQQIAPANILKSNKFNLPELLDFLRQMSFGKLPEDKRKFLIVTGEWGFADFSKEVENIPGVKSISGNGTGYSYAFGQGLGNKIHQGPVGGLTYNQPQYTKYIDIQGIEITLMHNPMYDDFVRFKKYHPTEAGLLESRRMTILDFGTEGGDSNIKRLVPKGVPAEIHRYIPGLRDPFSPSGSAMNPTPTSSKVDGYTIESAWTGGLAIMNPMRCGEYIIDTI